VTVARSSVEATGAGTSILSPRLYAEPPRQQRWHQIDKATRCDRRSDKIAFCKTRVSPLLFCPSALQELDHCSIYSDMIDLGLDQRYPLIEIRWKRMNPGASGDGTCRFDVVPVTALRHNLFLISEEIPIIFMTL